MCTFVSYLTARAYDPGTCVESLTRKLPVGQDIRTSSAGDLSLKNHKEITLKTMLSRYQRLYYMQSQGAVLINHPYTDWMSYSNNVYLYTHGVRIQIWLIMFDKCCSVLYSHTVSHMFLTCPYSPSTTASPAHCSMACRQEDLWSSCLRSQLQN